MLQRAHQHAPTDQFAYAKLVEVRLLRLPPERRDREIEVLLKSSGRENRHLLGVLARLRSQRGDDRSAAEAWGHIAGALASSTDAKDRSLAGAIVRFVQDVSRERSGRADRPARQPDATALRVRSGPEGDMEHQK